MQGLGPASFTSLNIRSCAVSALEEQGQSPGAYMGAGDRLIADLQYLFGRMVFLQQTDEVIRVLLAGGVGNAHQLLLRSPVCTL